MNAKEIVQELKKQMKFYAYAVDEKGNKAPVNPAIASQICKSIMDGTAKPSTEEAFLKRFGYSLVTDRHYSKGDVLETTLVHLDDEKYINAQFYDKHFLICIKDSEEFALTITQAKKFADFINTFLNNHNV